jgi:hypothetical protein
MQSAFRRSLKRLEREKGSVGIFFTDVGGVFLCGVTHPDPSHEEQTTAIGASSLKETFARATLA